jgi:hypothetical protein
MQERLIELLAKIKEQREIIKNEHATVDVAQKTINAAQMSINTAFINIDTANSNITLFESELHNLVLHHVDIEQDEPELFFDQDGRTIQWFSLNNDKVKITSKIKFTKQQYCFIHLLWNSSKHQATFSKIDKIIWKNLQTSKRTEVRKVKTKIGIIEKTVLLNGPKSKTVSKAIDRLLAIIKKSNFPYIIIKVRNRKTKEYQGLRIKCRKATKNKN